MIQEPGQIHVWSTMLKRWFALPVSSSAQFYGFDDHVLIVDGMQLNEFSTRFGRFETVQLNAPGPVVLPAPAPTHLAVAIDGNDVHVFSAMTGTWSTVHMTTSVSHASIDKLVAVVSDGNQTYGFGAQTNTPVALSTTGVTAVEAHGYGGYAMSGGQIHLFSGTRDSWRTEPFGTSDTVETGTLRAGMLVVHDATTYRFWSALTDDVASITVSPSAMLTLGDHASVLVDGSMVHAFSAPAGTLSTRLFNAPAVAASSAYFVLIQDGADLHAFSGPRATWSVLTGGASGNLVTNALSSSAVVQDANGVNHLYSAVKSTWSATSPISGAVPYLTYAGAVIADPAGGLYGYSALSDSITPLPGVSPSAVYQFGGNFCAQSGTRLDVFNPQLPAWRTAVTPVPATNISLHHQAVIAQAGNEVWFYGSYDDRWSRIVLPSAPTSTSVADQCGYVNAGDTVCAFGASGQIQNQAIFPEWWRLLTRGTDSTWNIVGEPGALPILILGFGPANIQIPGIGRLLVDPATAATAVLQPLPLLGATAVRLAVPDDPSLSGLELFAQAAIVRGDAIYLTNAHRSVIF